MWHRGFPTFGQLLRQCACLLQEQDVRIDTLDEVVHPFANRCTNTIQIPSNQTHRITSLREIFHLLNKVHSFDSPHPEGCQGDGNQYNDSNQHSENGIIGTKTTVK